MFTTAYIIILVVSTAIAAWAMGAMTARIQRMHKAAPPLLSAGSIAMAATVVFLMVVAAPPSLVMGMLVLTLATSELGRRYLPPYASWALPLLFVVFTAHSLHPPDLLSSLPPLLITTGLVLAWFGFTQSGNLLPAALPATTFGLAFVLLPLIIAPLLTSAPAYLPLDGALLLTGLAGVWSTRLTPLNIGPARPAIALLIGWMILIAACQGAWVISALSLGIWAALLVFAKRTATLTVPHASNV
jgi:hypothetical protein